VIVDASALVAVLREEAEGEEFGELIAAADIARVSAATFVETAIVIDSTREPLLSRLFDDFLLQSGITIEPVTERQARIAREAYRDFGRGSGHPARLNFGDCFSYALAKDTAEPLLFKGDDFIHTDVRPAARAMEDDRGE
jgi:ribonuclease VapC